MSSIYKKGRDGFYYYQAYVLNPKTKKKDKRIFHALRTKEKLVAIKKKEELDKKYSKKNNKLILTLSKNRLWYSGISISLFVFFVFRFFNDMEEISPLVVPIEKNLINLKSSVKKNNSYRVNHAELSKNKIPDLVSESKKPSEIMVGKSIVSDHIIDYEIIKIVQKPGLFKQGKVNISIEKKANQMEREQLCRKIAADHPQFKNIIICLYSSDKIGRELASNSGGRLLSEEQKDSWLGMFTYNPIEGSYFDMTPAKYYKGY